MICYNDKLTIYHRNRTRMSTVAYMLTIQRKFVRFLVEQVFTLYVIPRKALAQFNRDNDFTQYFCGLRASNGVDLGHARETGFTRLGSY